MQTVEFSEYGPASVLRVVERAEPAVGPGQVAVEVAYTGVNFADVKARGSGYRVAALPFVPGLEVSGRVREVGEGVAGLAVGDEVVAFLEGGGYAEVAVADAARTFRLPDGLDARQAAALSTVLVTAYGLLFHAARIGTGESVLVQGAAGGVGTVAGQLAAAAGASAVYGVVSTSEKAAYAQEFGYTDVFLAEDFDVRVREATGGRGVDVLLDPVGGDTWRRGLGALAWFGRAVSYGNASGEPAWSAGFEELSGRAQSAGAFSILTIGQTSPPLLRELTEKAFAFAAKSGVSVPVTAEFALRDAPAAHELIESRASTGKLLLRVGG
ncbi:quinone oxidoreductase family protein [Phaeacidiphilus oryzae]|uniref:quinone oxidoreductase family protein n=1 Tax=Phaeacidiphilus oryzae TaxID=348818 RepID=UPI00055BFF59|nr:zinc-binding dehydrogenase [Phaeacidiphilus oryzae]